MKHILVPLDGSGLAARTVATAADLADRLSARLLFLAVIPPPGQASPDAERGAPEAARDRIRRFFDEVLGRTTASLVPDTEIVEGDPAERILAVARTRSVDMVAMATHGRPALSRSFLGPVTQAVLAGSSVPVFVMRPEILPMPWESLPPRGVVIVPLDGSHRAEGALPLACLLARAYRARLAVVRIVPPHAVPALQAAAPVSDQVDAEFAKAKRDANDYLERTARLPRLECMQVGTRMAVGRPAEEIVRLAAQEEDALVVIASSRMTGTQAQPRESVADALVQAGPVPTVVVPARGV